MTNRCVHGCFHHPPRTVPSGTGSTRPTGDRARRAAVAAALTSSPRRSEPKCIGPRRGPPGLASSRTDAIGTGSASPTPGWALTGFSPRAATLGHHPAPVAPRKVGVPPGPAMPGSAVTVPTRPVRRAPDDRHIKGNCPDVGSERSATPGDPLVFAVVGLNGGAVGFRRWRGVERARGQRVPLPLVSAFGARFGVGAGRRGGGGVAKWCGFDCGSC